MKTKNVLQITCPICLRRFRSVRRFVPAHLNSRKWVCHGSGSWRGKKFNGDQIKPKRKPNNKGKQYGKK